MFQELLGGVFAELRGAQYGRLHGAPYLQDVFFMAAEISLSPKFPALVLHIVSVFENLPNTEYHVNDLNC
jgi:hypothetical protein